MDLGDDGVERERREPEELSALTKLDRSLLHVFVCGGGFGEAVVVALPSRGWLVVDGCTARGPLGSKGVPLSVLQQFGPPMDADPLELVVLSHPHEDHAAGFAQLVDAHPPRRVMVTARAPEGPFLHDTMSALLGGSASAPTSARLVHGEVLAAVRAVRRLVDDGVQVVAGIEPTSLTLGETQIDVRAPNPCAHLDGIFGDLASGRRERANHASVVLELSWRDARIVLTGDLPTSQPTGLSCLLDRHGHLADHDLLKLPHHGSEGAHEPRLMSPTTRTHRAWAATPYSRSRLPRLEALRDLLGREGAIHLSARPAAWAQLPSDPVGIGEIRLRREAEATGDPFADGADDVTPIEHDPLEPVWAFALDAAGHVVGRWRGGAARRIVA